MSFGPGVVSKEGTLPADAPVVMTKKQYSRLKRERGELAARLARAEEQLQKLGPRELGANREDPDILWEELLIQIADARRRLVEIDGWLARPQLIPRKSGSQQITLGSRVTVEFLTGDRRILTVNITDNGDPQAGAISYRCELAKAIWNHRAGELVRFVSGGQTREVRILSVR